MVNLSNTLVTVIMEKFVCTLGLTGGKPILVDFRITFYYKDLPTPFTQYSVNICFFLILLTLKICLYGEDGGQGRV